MTIVACPQKVSIEPVITAKPCFLYNEVALLRICKINSIIHYVTSMCRTFVNILRELEDCLSILGYMHSHLAVPMHSFMVVQHLSGQRCLQERSL